MHPIRALALAVIIVGLTCVAVLVFGLPAGLEEWVPWELYLVVGLGGSLILPGVVVAAAPGPPIEPFDFEDWLDELGVGQRAMLLLSWLVSVGVLAYLAVPWSELESIFE